MKTTLFCLLALLPPAVQAPATPGAPAASPAAQTAETLEPAAIGSTEGAHRAGNLWLSGQFAEEDLPALRALGIRRVITLREEGELAWDERGAVEGAGLEFAALGFREPAAMSDQLLDRLRGLLAADTPTLLHCASANRVGAAWVPFRVLDQGVPLERALAEAELIGLRTPALRERAVAYVELRSADVDREPSVREGVNDDFKAADLDVAQFVARFEVESREVYAARHAVIAALELTPGLRVADVGAGTGLYTFLLSESVGPTGWVFAVDIAPRFLEHIRGLAAERRVGNVTAVLCPETDIGLPPDSVDLAYVCDTFHHFEFPVSTLRSIHRALVPGGRLVVLDFERDPERSRQWVLDHVRAGKEVFRSEIASAGFEYLREIEVAGLSENYLIEFRKPAR
jgi:ubiquinone/menaquinone biosynthesis C-methylase UbiE/protein tyrosine phosphatase (PTP) superfamily phosphohydrolase (DUF442 family)